MIIPKLKANNAALNMYNEPTRQPNSIAMQAKQRHVKHSGLANEPQPKLVPKSGSQYIQGRKRQELESKTLKRVTSGI